MTISKCLQKWTNHSQVNFSLVEHDNWKQYVFDVPSIPNLVTELVSDLYKVDDFFKEGASSITIDHAKKCCTTVILFI